MGLFERGKISGKTQLPVWFMRQAGRYHDHYQGIRKDHLFMDMCKDPSLACEITMGPINDFNFDAAILFSDLLFPLEHLGLGLDYQPGPTLERKISSIDDVKSLQQISPAHDFYQFQKEALKLLKQALPTNKTLLGFVGAPFTLYTYACEGSHAGNLLTSKKGLYNGCFMAFWEKLKEGLAIEMQVQAEGGADVICLFDTAAGELSLYDYNNFIAPTIREITSEFKQKNPSVKILYYSKHTHREYFNVLNDRNIDILGFDWRHDLPKVYQQFSDDYYIQGNIDPVWLHLSWKDLQHNCDQLWQQMRQSTSHLDRWIFGLGHGVSVGTPQENVLALVKHIHQHYHY